jgi:hypothetical protein
MITFDINNRTYTKRYYLAGVVYPSWAIFLKTVSEPHTDKRIYFSKCQESCRKDFKRAFGVLLLGTTLLLGLLLKCGR